MALTLSTAERETATSIRRHPWAMLKVGSKFEGKFLAARSTRIVTVKFPVVKNR